MGQDTPTNRPKRPPNKGSSKEPTKRRKVAKACIFCKRSHMTCDDGRPCQRCIKREIGHLCQDEPHNLPSSKETKPSTSATTSAEPVPSTSTPTPAASTEPPNPTPTAPSSSLPPTSSIPSSTIQLPSTSSSTQQSTPGLIAGTISSRPLMSPSMAAAAAANFPTAALPIITRETLSATFLGGSNGSGNGNGGPFRTNLISSSSSSGGHNATLLSAPSTSMQGSSSSSNHSTGGNYNLLMTTNSSSSGGRRGSILGNLSMLADDPLLGGVGAAGTSAKGGVTGGGEGNEFYGLGLSDFLRSLDEPYLGTDPSSLNDDLTSVPHSSNAPGNGSNIHITSSSSFDPSGLLVTSSNHGDVNGRTSSDTSMTGPASGSKGNGEGSIPQHSHQQLLSPASQPVSITSHQPSTTSATQQPPKSLQQDPSTQTISPSNKTERFLLTAADQVDGSRDERLARVIHAKFEAGLLKPYNYVKGYSRLMRWMETNMSQKSRQRVLQTLSEFRPAFRAIASSLTDLDLVFIEEAFERLLLDYDRVFASMGVPACLWRRTGEIYKGNKEFAELVGVPIEMLREGRLAVYELMAEESAVNYWDKYGDIAFDAGQKAVLTSCVLINQAVANLHRKRKKKAGVVDGGRFEPPEEAIINATFSFTIRRDHYNITTSSTVSEYAISPERHCRQLDADFVTPYRKKLHIFAIESDFASSVVGVYRCKGLLSSEL